MTACYLNPPQVFGGAELVASNLADALGESGQRVVLVVEPDRNDRNRVVGLLRELGTMAFGVASGNEGIVRARHFPAQDMIVVSAALNKPGEAGDPLAVQFIDALRDDYRTRNVPVLLLARKDGQEEAQSLVDAGRAMGVVEPFVARETLNGWLDRAFGSPSAMADDKARSDDLALRAAEALAAVPRGHTQFEVAVAGPALAANVSRSFGRPDAVRLACLRALQAVGPLARDAALDVLHREFQDPLSSAELKRALARTIGDCVKGGPLPEEVFRTLLPALDGDDPELWEAVFYALGNAVLTGEQARAVFVAQRQQ